MAGNILTPNAIWNGFLIPSVPQATVIDERKAGDLYFKRLSIEGRSIKNEKVNIFGLLAGKKQNLDAPAILLLQDLEYALDESLVKVLVKKGFTVFAIDIAGYQEGKEFYTKYPESVSYANYAQNKNGLYSVERQADKTCWYEWTCVARYALKYLKSITDTVGGFGIGKSATVMWQVAGMDDTLDCSVFALNAGWLGYKDIYKFGSMVEPQFSDDMCKYIAGIEPQAYAAHVKNPVLVLTATNSAEYDSDRAYDTLARTGETVYSAVHYSVGCRDRVNAQAFNDAIMFFNKFLLEKQSKNLPMDVDIRADIEDGEVNFIVTPQEGEIKSVVLYVSEQTVKPSIRCWRKFGNAIETSGVYKFTVKPYHNSNMVVAFAQVEYENGYVIGSNVINKKFKQEEVKQSFKSNIIYSSRYAFAESVFYDEVEVDDCPSVSVVDKKTLRVKKGPMGLEGVTGVNGLLTFKIGTEKDRPSDSAMLMLDAYSKEQSTLTVKLYSDYTGERREYLYKTALNGGDVWQNVKIELSKFKTAEGMGLKSLDKVDAIAFDVDGEFLINNALWV